MPDIIDFEEYQKLAMRTESLPDFPMPQLVQYRITHACLGIGSEGGELIDAEKKRFAYGKPFDVVNLIEEAGDVIWYLAILLDALGVSLSEVCVRNIEKLRARYPEKFTQDAALNRDLENERRVLENGESE